MQYRILLLTCCCSIALFAADAPKPGPDTLLFTNGEKLIGHLERATNKEVVFKSDMAGEVTVKWSRIQELRTGDKFAAVRKGTELTRGEAAATVPQGTITGTAQQIQVRPSPQAPPQTLETGNVAHLVPESAFERALRSTNFFEGWTGGLTGGVSLTEATQSSRTFTAAVALLRNVPGETWLDRRSRTTVEFNEAYGKLTQPGTPSVKTSLYHLGAEQDWYFSPRMFGFVQASFDHNFSQGLNLQQSYGGGLGVTALKSEKQEFDMRASVDYTDQRFEVSSSNQQLIGSNFGESYVRTFAHSIVLNERGVYLPAWNNTRAYSALGTAALTFPVFHRLGLTLGALDTFLNDPPPGFKKNSFQFTAGVTYAIR